MVRCSVEHHMIPSEHRLEEWTCVRSRKALRVEWRAMMEACYPHHHAKVQRAHAVAGDDTAIKG